MIAIRSLPLRTFAAALLVVSASSAQALTSFSDSFESPSIGSQPYVTYTANQTFGSGWKVTGNSIDIVSNNWQPQIQAADGAQFLDLAGTAPGGISRLLALDPGFYTLSFAYRGNTFDASPVGNAYMALSIAGIADPYVIYAPTSQNTWLTASFNFQATQPSTMVSFSSLVAGASGTGGMLLDSVQVAVVPEPHEWMMMLSGLGLVGVIAKRRRRRRS